MSWDYPVFLDLRGRRCLVIGDGWAVPHKVRDLVRAGAQVTVLAPQVAPEIQKLEAEGAVRHLPREYAPGDLAGYFLAVSIFEDKSRNEPIWREAMSCNILFNALDDPPRCVFSFPCLQRRGGLVVAISTGGKSPALAVRLRERLEREIGPEYGVFAELLGELRGEVARRVPGFSRRREIWYRLVDSDALRRIRAGDVEGAWAELRALINAEAGGGNADG